MLSLNKAASPWNVDMPYKMKDRLYIYIDVFCAKTSDLYMVPIENLKSKTCVSHHHLRDQRTYTAQKEQQERKQASAVFF